MRKVLEKQEVNQSTRIGQNNCLLVDALLEPTAIYAQLVKNLLKENLPINGMAHITGGGIPENLPRCLPDGLIAVIDPKSWEIPEIFYWLRQSGDIPESDLWNTFNLGIGFCIVISPNAESEALNICKNSGFTAWSIGTVKENLIANQGKLVGIPSFNE